MLMRFQLVVSWRILEGGGMQCTEEARQTFLCTVKSKASILSKNLKKNLKKVKLRMNLGMA